MTISIFKKNKIKPDIKSGTIWQAPNRIWTTNFAKNKNVEGLHPAMVERMNNDSITAYLTPGTSKEYKQGSCVFRLRLRSHMRQSHFLLKYTMPYLKSDLASLNQGWDGVTILDEEQKKALRWQIKICKGIEVGEDIIPIKLNWWQKLIKIWS